MKIDFKKTQLINIKDLDRSRTQLRMKTTIDAVRDYAEAMGSKNADFPPIVVFHDETDDKYYLADGFHRTKAAELLECETILAVVVKGTFEDAILYAANCNNHNAVRRSNKDKRKSVLVLIDVFPGKPQRWIAEACGVTQPFVSGLLKELANKDNDKSSEKRVGKSVEERFCEAASTLKRLFDVIGVYQITSEEALSAAGVKLIGMAELLSELLTVQVNHESQNEVQADVTVIPPEAIAGPVPKKLKRIASKA